jgi:hypothetical protein
MSIAFTFVVDKALLEPVFKAAIDNVLSITSWGEVRGSMAKTLQEMATSEIERMLTENDSALLKQHVAHAMATYLNPTLEQIVQEKIKTEARKALKNAKVSNAELLE